MPPKWCMASSSRPHSTWPTAIWSKATCTPFGWLPRRWSSTPALLRCSIWNNPKNPCNRHCATNSPPPKSPHAPCTAPRVSWPSSPPCWLAAAGFPPSRSMPQCDAPPTTSAPPSSAGACWWTPPASRWTWPTRWSKATPPATPKSRTPSAAMATLPANMRCCSSRATARTLISTPTATWPARAFCLATTSRACHSWPGYPPRAVQPPKARTTKAAWSAARAFWRCLNSGHAASSTTRAACTASCAPSSMWARQTISRATASLPPWPAASAASAATPTWAAKTAPNHTTTCAKTAVPSSPTSTGCAVSTALKPSKPSRSSASPSTTKTASARALTCKPPTASCPGLTARLPSTSRW